MPAGDPIAVAVMAGAQHAVAAKERVPSKAWLLWRSRLPCLHLVGCFEDGSNWLEAVDRPHLEGIVSKRKALPFRDWDQGHDKNVGAYRIVRGAALELMASRRVICPNSTNVDRASIM